MNEKVKFDDTVTRGGTEYRLIHYESGSWWWSPKRPGEPEPTHGPFPSRRACVADLDKFLRLEGSGS